MELVVKVLTYLACFLALVLVVFIAGMPLLAGTGDEFTVQCGNTPITFTEHVQIDGSRAEVFWITDGGSVSNIVAMASEDWPRDAAIHRQKMAEEFMTWAGCPNTR